MSSWRATKAKRILAALERLGWKEKRRSGSHRTLSRPGWPDVVGKKDAAVFIFK
jgi:predicted RNA binding protein YcfA (HicA-like mRNA interferase family)